MMYGNINGYLWQVVKPITTLNNQNCANILVNMEYILYLCVIIQI